MFVIVVTYSKICFGAAYHFAWRSVMRLVVWVLGVAAAAFPALYASHNSMPPWHMAKIMQKIVAAGLFRDFFYVTIIVAIIGLSDILYIIFTDRGFIHIWMKAVLFIMAIIFLFFLVTGIGEFSALANVAEVTGLPQDEIDNDMTVFMYACIAGAITELVLAIRDA